MAIERLTQCAYPDGDTIYIGEVVGETPDELAIAAQGIHEVLMASWQKFVQSRHITAHGLAKKIRQPFTQAEIMAESAGSARYLMVFDGDSKLQDPSQVRGFARIETYKPHSPFKKAYPNITDLEFRSGRLSELKTARDARAVVYQGLRPFDPEQRVAAYTEAPNESGRYFFTTHGFRERRVTPEEVIDEDSAISYVHMEAPDHQTIFRTYPAGEHSFTYY